MSMYWPLLVVVLSNTFYHVCAKATPADANTFASLSVTYAVGALVSLILFCVTQKSGALLAEYRRLNWSSFVLGIAIVGLEAGFLLMYKAGWSISTAQVVQGAVLAVILVILGGLFYHEAITFKKIIGIVVCLVGLYFINS